MVGLVDHLGEEADGFGFSLFPDRGITYLTVGLVGFLFPGKVRLSSVDLLGEVA